MIDGGWLSLDCSPSLVHGEIIGLGFLPILVPVTLRPALPPTHKQ